MQKHTKRFLPPVVFKNIYCPCQKLMHAFKVTIYGKLYKVETFIFVLWKASIWNSKICFLCSTVKQIVLLEPSYLFTSTPLCSSSLSCKCLKPAKFVPTKSHRPPTFNDRPWCGKTKWLNKNWRRVRDERPFPWEFCPVLPRQVPGCPRRQLGHGESQEEREGNEQPLQLRCQRAIT